MVQRVGLEVGDGIRWQGSGIKETCLLGVLESGVGQRRGRCSGGSMCGGTELCCIFHSPGDPVGVHMESTCSPSTPGSVHP